MICLVDDDAGIRYALRLLLNEAKLPFASYPDAARFLEQFQSDGEAMGCLILNLNLPGMNGFELFQRLKGQGLVSPVLFLSGSADVAFAVKAVREGAMDVLLKPFREGDLLGSIQAALDRYSRLQQARREKQVILQRLDRLTRREREVLELMAQGQKNRNIAQELGISEKTLDIHRTKVREKMEAPTVAAIVRWWIYAKAEIGTWPGSVGGLNNVA